MKVTRYCELDDTVEDPITTTIKNGVIVTKVKMELHIEHKPESDNTTEAIKEIDKDIDAAIDIIGSAFATHEEYALCQRTGRV